MQLEGSEQRPAAAQWLTTVPQRLSVIAFVLTVAVIALAAFEPAANYLSFTAVAAAYATVAATLIGIVLAHRRQQSLRELLSLLVYALLVAQIATWAMFDPRGPLVAATKLYTRIGDAFAALFS